jgi:hypothetical protein
MFAYSQYILPVRINVSTGLCKSNKQFSVLMDQNFYEDPGENPRSTPSSSLNTPHSHTSINDNNLPSKNDEHLLLLLRVLLLFFRAILIIILFSQRKTTYLVYKEDSQQQQQQQSKITQRWKAMNRI